MPNDTSPLHKGADAWEAFRVPWEKDAVATGPTPMAKQEVFDKRTIGCLASFWHRRHQEHCTYGFPIHKYCWDLIKRIVGPGAENELGTFLNALSQRWEEQPFEVGSCLRGKMWNGIGDDSGTILPECLDR